MLSNMFLKLVWCTFRTTIPSTTINSINGSNLSSVNILYMFLTMSVQQFNIVKFRVIITILHLHKRWFTHSSFWKLQDIGCWRSALNQCLILDQHQFDFVRSFELLFEFFNSLTQNLCTSVIKSCSFRQIFIGIFLPGHNCSQVMVAIFKGWTLVTSCALVFVIAKTCSRL
jgi:hypothetical protein